MQIKDKELFFSPSDLITLDAASTAPEYTGFFALCVCNSTFTVSNGCPSSVTVIPPHVPANTSFANFTPAEGSFALDAANGARIAPPRGAEVVVDAAPLGTPAPGASFISANARIAHDACAASIAPPRTNTTRCSRAEGVDDDVARIA